MRNRRLTHFAISPMKIETEVKRDEEGWAFVGYVLPERRVLFRDYYSTIEGVALAEAVFWENDATCDYFGEPAGARPHVRAESPVCRYEGKCRYQVRHGGRLVCNYLHKYASLGKPRPFEEHLLPEPEYRLRDFF